MREIERKEEVEKRHTEEIQARKMTKQDLMVPFPFIAEVTVHLMPLKNLITFLSFRKN